MQIEKSCEVGSPQNISGAAQQTEVDGGLFFFFFFKKSFFKNSKSPEASEAYKGVLITSFQNNLGYLETWRLDIARMFLFL